MFTNDFRPKHPTYINTASFVDDFSFWQNPLKYRQQLQQLPRPPYVYTHVNMDQLLQKAVTHFTQWCNYNQMAVSPKKSDQLFICASNNSNQHLYKFKGLPFLQSPVPQPPYSHS